MMEFPYNYVDCTWALAQPRDSATRVVHLALAHPISSAVCAITSIFF